MHITVEDYKRSDSGEAGVLSGEWERDHSFFLFCLNNEKGILPVLNANKNSMCMLCVCGSAVLIGRHKREKKLSWKQESARCEDVHNTHTGQGVFGLLSQGREQLVQCVCMCVLASQI